MCKELGVFVMPIFETFAKRKKKAQNSGKPVIYRYDELPTPFRVQVVHIWGQALDLSPYDSFAKDCWEYIHDTLAKEMGVFELLPNSGHRNRLVDCSNFLLQSKDTDQVLSLMELSFHCIDTLVRYKGSRHYYADWGNGTKQTPDNAIRELNYRFQEHAIGYQYAGGQIVEINSQFLHSETVEPVITLLHDAGFEGALQEFMTAHKYYRERNYKEAIVNSSNAFESTMRTICDIRRWAYPQNATSSKLIDILFDNDLVTTEMKSHFTSLRSTLASGVPTIRNKGGQGGHGQGSSPVEVPDHIAAYALHLTASNIVFLVESHKALGR